MIRYIFKQFHLKRCRYTEHHHRCDAVAGTRQWSYSVQQHFLLFGTALKQWLYKLYLGLSTIKFLCFIIYYLFASTSRNSSAFGPEWLIGKLTVWSDAAVTALSFLFVCNETSCGPAAVVVAVASNDNRCLLGLYIRDFSLKVRVVQLHEHTTSISQSSLNSRTPTQA